MGNSIGGDSNDSPPPTEEEIAAQKEHERKTQLETATMMFVRTNTKTLSDKEVLSVSMLFDIWQPNTEYTKDDIYRIGQNHTSQKQWIPGEPGTESLYSLIHIDEGGYETWKEWDGISGIYDKGQIVRDPNDGKLYSSKIPNNVLGPPNKQPTYWGPV